MLLRVEDVSHFYNCGLPCETKALENVSLSLLRGEVLGLIGPTGSGKSTLVAIMSGLMKPASGRMFFENIDVYETGEDFRIDRENKRLRLGVVFQYPEHCLFEDTVLKDVAFGPLVIGLSEEEAMKRARRALEEVGLSPDEMSVRSPFELSGGQKRKAAIAGILALDPYVLILDEPTAGLDPLSAKGIRKIIEERARQGNAILLVTHDLEYLSGVADRVAVISGGRLIHQGSVQEVLADVPLLESTGLEPPVTARFIQHFKLHCMNNSKGVSELNMVHSLDPVLLAREVAQWWKGSWNGTF